MRDCPERRGSIQSRQGEPRPNQCRNTRFVSSLIYLIVFRFLLSATRGLWNNSKIKNHFKITNHKRTQIQRQWQWQRHRKKSTQNIQRMQYFWNPDDSIIPNMMIDNRWSTVHVGHPGHPSYPVPVTLSVLQGRVYHRFGFFPSWKSLFSCNHKCQSNPCVSQNPQFALSGGRSGVYNLFHVQPVLWRHTTQKPAQT